MRAELRAALRAQPPNLLDFALLAVAGAALLGGDIELLLFLIFVALTRVLFALPKRTVVNNVFVPVPPKPTAEDRYWQGRASRG